MDRPSGETRSREVGWFCVRCIFQVRSTATGQVYEERLTLWRAGGFDEAITLAEAEAREYADDELGMVYVGLAQAYHLYDEPRHGAEVFSLLRESGLESQAYLTRFFDTGEEKQGHVHPGA